MQTEYPKSKMLKTSQTCRWVIIILLYRLISLPLIIIHRSLIYCLEEQNPYKSCFSVSQYIIMYMWIRVTAFSTSTSFMVLSSAANRYWGQVVSSLGQVPMIPLWCKVEFPLTNHLKCNYFWSMGAKFYRPFK